jgi:ethanolamine utilization protein EutN
VQICKVVGNVVSTQKNQNLVGSKLLLVQSIDSEGNTTGGVFVAVDTVGAGFGERVLVTKGSSARNATGDEENSPVDAAIVGIIDSIEYNGQGCRL